MFDAAKAPYDPDYYLRKLDDWVERYAGFLESAASGNAPEQMQQGELL